MTHRDAPSMRAAEAASALTGVKRTDLSNLRAATHTNSSVPVRSYPARSRKAAAPGDRSPTVTATVCRVAVSVPITELRAVGGFLP